jgi:tRNA pseudouridine55 synthase
VTVPPGGGVLPVDKPAGPTSHDVVARVRRALRTRRVGHTGTLDPFASGLLLMVVDGATRLSPYLTGLEKSYLAEARLGIETDTLDTEGAVVSQSEEWRALDPGRVRDALEGLGGTSLQDPPAYSAKKVGGEAAHRRVRRGEALTLDPVPVTVLEIELLALDLPTVSFRVRCSSGTYVRALARDLGRQLGVGAHLTALRRTAVGGFRVDEASSLEDLDAGIAPAWISPVVALERAGLVSVTLDAQAVGRMVHGQVVPLPEGDAVPPSGQMVAAVDGEGLVAVAEAGPDGLRPRKVFRSAEAVR